MAYGENVRAAVEKQAKVKLDPGVTECFQGLVGGEIAAYACIDNMIGRERYITYLIRIDHPDGKIAFIEVMEYREAVGAMVQFPWFTRHLVGKTVRPPTWSR